MCRLPMTSNQSSKAIGRLKLAVIYFCNVLMDIRAPTRRGEVTNRVGRIIVAEEKRNRACTEKTALPNRRVSTLTAFSRQTQKGIFVDQGSLFKKAESQALMCTTLFSSITCFNPAPQVVPATPHLLLKHSFRSTRSFLLGVNACHQQGDRFNDPYFFFNTPFYVCFFFNTEKSLHWRFLNVLSFKELSTAFNVCVYCRNIYLFIWQIQH